jgi:hypothetical protein
VKDAKERSERRKIKKVCCLEAREREYLMKDGEKVM